MPLSVALGTGVAAVLAACCAGAALGEAGEREARTEVRYSASPYPVVTTVTVVETTTVAVEVSPTMPPAPPGPKTSIDGDGTYLVGVDIQPGTYRTKVPESSVNCYWQRMKGTSGGMEDIIANDNVALGASAIVTISSADKAFKASGCGAWEKVG